MKQRKIILLHCTDDQRQAELRFILETRGYRVIGGISSHAPIPHLTLVVDEGQESVDLVRELKQRWPDRQVMVLAHKARRSTPYEQYPGATVLPRGISMEDALIRVRITAQRKRGPKRASAATRNVEEASA